MALGSGPWEVKGISGGHQYRFGGPWRLWSEGVRGGGGARRLQLRGGPAGRREPCWGREGPTRTAGLVSPVAGPGGSEARLIGQQWPKAG